MNSIYTPQPTDQPLKTEQIKDNNRTFEFDTYNGITVIIDKTTGYYNAGKICSDNHKSYKHLKELKRYNEYIKVLESLVSRNSDQPITYELDSTFTNETRGTYIHPKLVNFVCEWASLEYCVRVGEIMDLINTELHQENISLRQYIEKLNQGRTSITGEIVIMPATSIRKENTEDKQVYKLHMNQFKTISQNPNFTYIQVNNAAIVQRNVVYYTCAGLVKDIEYLGKNIVFGSIDNIKEVILQIANKTFCSTISIDEAIKALDDKYKNSNSKRVRYGYEFEIYCAKKYHMPPYRFGNTEFLGTDHKDIGLDLLDLETHRAAQCKRNDGVIYYNQLRTFINFVDYIRETYSDENWTFYLFCLNTTEFEPSLNSILKLKNIEIIHEDYSILPTDETLNTEDPSENIKFTLRNDNLQFKELGAEEFINNELKKYIHLEPLLDKQFIFKHDLEHDLPNAKIKILIEKLKEEGWHYGEDMGELAQGGLYYKKYLNDDKEITGIFNKICKYHPITHYKYFNTCDLVPEIKDLTIFTPRMITAYLANKFDLTNIACTYDGVRGWKFNGVFEENPKPYMQKWKNRKVFPLGLQLQLKEDIINEIFEKVCKIHPKLKYKYFNNSDIIPELKKHINSDVNPITVISKLSKEYNLTNIPTTPENTRGWAFVETMPRKNEGEENKEINELIKPIIKSDEINNFEYFELEELRELLRHSKNEREVLETLRNEGWKIKDGRKSKNSNETYHGLYIRTLPKINQIRKIQNMINEVIKEDENNKDILYYYASEVVLPPLVAKSLTDYGFEKAQKMKNGSKQRTWRITFEDYEKFMEL